MSLRKNVAGALGLFWMLLWAVGVAQADVKQIKAYKEAYPDAKPRCAACHADEKPKKEDGQHELNDYGKKAVAVKPETDAESYKQAGPVSE